MEPKTLELLRVLQAGARDARAFDSIRSLLATERSRLASADDRATLADVSELLEMWAEGAPPAMAAVALMEAAQIAELHLEQSERAVQLYLDSLDQEPGDLSALHKIEELLGRQKDSDRLENVLSEQAAALRIRDNFEPLLTAEVYRKLARLRAERGDQSAAIEAYEQALDVSADAGVIRDLADAYAKRGGDTDRTQAADLYCTLGDVMGAPEGAEWLECALDQLPGHDAALDLLESFVPAEQHADRLIKRWQAYVEHSDDEASIDKRRMLLARAHAARGAARDALICLGPLIERSDADALELQTECLASLRAGEQRESAPGSKAQPAGKPIKPATLVGFRVPPKDPQQPFETAEPAEPVSETRSRPSAKPAAAAAAPAAQPAPEPKPAPAAKTSTPIVSQPLAGRATPAAQPAAKLSAAAAAKLASAKEAAPPQQQRKRPARSGETLVGFHLPPELAGDRDSDAEAQAEAALEEAAAELAAHRASESGAERVESSRVVLRAGAPAQSVPSARASGAGDARPASSRQAASTAAPSRAHARTLMGVAPTGPAAAAAALKAAAAARAPSMPPAARASSAPDAAVSAAAKAAALRAAALRATVPAGLQGAAVPERASTPAPAPAKVSSRPPFPGRANGAPAAPPALAPTLPIEQVANEAAAAAAEPSPEQPAVAPSATPSLTPSLPSALSDNPFLRAAAAPATNRRWWIASAVALTVLGGAIALIARPTSKNAPAPAPVSRVESAPALPAPTPVPVAATPAPSTATPSTAMPSAAMPSAAAPASGSTAAPSAPQPAAAQPAAAPSRRAERHADPEVKAIAKQIKVKGAGLSNKDVLGALDDAIDKIETCYGRILDKNPRVQGDLSVGFTVDKAGKATHVRKLSATTLKDSGAQRCATEAIGKTRFPKPDKKKPVSVTAGLSFKKG